MLLNHTILLRVIRAIQQLSTKRGPAIKLLAEQDSFQRTLLMRDENIADSQDENVADSQFDIFFVRGAVEFPEKAPESAIGYITYVPGSEIRGGRSLLSCLVSLSESTFDDLWLHVRNGLDGSTDLEIVFGPVKLEGRHEDELSYVWQTEQSPFLFIFEAKFTFGAVAPFQGSYIFEKLRREAVEHDIRLPKDASDDLKRAKTGDSLLRSLLNEITKSAKEVAVGRNMSVDDFAHDLLPEATGIVTDIQGALIHYVPEPTASDLKASWNFWNHVQNPFYRIQKQEIPYIERSSLQSAAARYLNSPFRCVPIDRLLVDALMAAEIFAFGNEMWNPGSRWAPSMKQFHPLGSYLITQVLYVVVFGGIIAFTAWLYSRGIIGEPAFGWTAGIPFGLMVLFFSLGTIFLPSLWRRQAKTKRKIVALMEDMIGVYTELQSSGPISAEHIRVCAQRLAESGKWPATLFALLDDVVRRTGRF